MADNRIEYGFRWFRGFGGKPRPEPIPMTVATGTSFDVNGGAQNVSLRIGDPVKLANTGTVTLCDGTEDSSSAVHGIVVGVGPYYNSTDGVMTPTRQLPDATAWGTVEDRKSQVWVCPADQGIWEIDCDEATTATTIAAYRLLIGENADHILTGAVGASYATPRLDISTHATTNTLQWRIWDISPTMNNIDASGNYFKLLVRANVSSVPAAGTRTGT